MVGSKVDVNGKGERELGTCVRRSAPCFLLTRSFTRPSSCDAKAKAHNAKIRKRLQI